MSNYDPFSLYRHHQRKSHTGQVIRKKPISIRGAYSREDLEKAREVMKAYGEIPKPVTPAPKVPGLYLGGTVNELITFQYNTQGTYNVGDIWDEFKESLEYNQLNGIAQTSPNRTATLVITVTVPTLILNTLTSYSGLRTNFNVSFPGIGLTNWIPSYGPAIPSSGQTVHTGIFFNMVPTQKMYMTYPAWVSASSTQNTTFSTGISSSVDQCYVNVYIENDVPYSVLADPEYSPDEDIIRIIQTVAPAQTISMTMNLICSYSVFVSPTTT